MRKINIGSPGFYAAFFEMCLLISYDRFWDIQRDWERERLKYVNSFFYRVNYFPDTVLGYIRGILKKTR